MSRPPIHRTEYYSDSLRCTSLKPFFQTIIDRTKVVEKKPTTNVKPIMNPSEKEHLLVCFEHFKNYIDCREINPEYNCEAYRQYILKLKCI